MNANLNISRTIYIVVILSILLNCLYSNSNLFYTTKKVNKSELIERSHKRMGEMNKVSSTRSIFKHFIAVEQNEGVGARVRRSIGTNKLRNFAPFLMLDHFNVAPPAGFPEHPHHGQETITYVLQGLMAHEDFTGSKGVLRPGDLQFMTAGKGIVHSEIPVKMNNGESTQGLQLWVDLPKDMKNIAPRYRDLRLEDIPIAHPSEHLKVKVISGESYGVHSPAELAYTPINFYHFIASKNGIEFSQTFDEGFSSFLYILKGSIKINGQEFPQFSALFFNTDGDGVEGITTSENTEFALVGGKILDQEVVQYGPFVETSMENIIEVMNNYQRSDNGFEKSRTWSPSINVGITESEVEEYLPK